VLLLISEVSELKRGLKEAEDSLKAVPKMERVEDVFHRIIPKCIKRSSVQIEQMEELLNEAIKEFQKTADLYGENGKIVDPEQFFRTISQFMDLIQKTLREMNEFKLKEEKAKKRHEEEEKHQRVKEQKQRQREEARGNKGKTRESSLHLIGRVETEGSGERERLMDNALAQLRGGDIWLQKRKERQEKKQTDEVKALDSIMGTLSSIASGGENDSQSLLKTPKPGKESPSLLSPSFSKPSLSLSKPLATPNISSLPIVVNQLSAVPSNQNINVIPVNNNNDQDRKNKHPNDQDRSIDKMSSSSSNHNTSSTEPNFPVVGNEKSSIPNENSATFSAAPEDPITPRDVVGNTGATLIGLASSSSTQLSDLSSSSSSFDDDLSKRMEERRKQRELKKKQREEEEKRELEEAERKREERRKRLEALRQASN